MVSRRQVLLWTGLVVLSLFKVTAVTLVFSIPAVGDVASCTYVLSKQVSTRGVEVTPEPVNEQLDEDFQRVPSLGQR
jgi:hypothetical protein